MPLMLDRGPQVPLPSGDREGRRQARREARRAALDRWSAEDCRRAEINRVVICSGPHLLAWYPAGALAEVLADVGRWAADSGYFNALPWPLCCQRFWDWNAGEELAVWQAGRLLAVVMKTAAGGVVVKRLADLDRA